MIKVCTSMVNSITAAVAMSDKEMQQFLSTTIHMYDPEFHWIYSIMQLTQLPKNNSTGLECFEGEKHCYVNRHFNMKTIRY